MSEERASASADLHYVRKILEQTQARIDPHAFHFVMWGTLVLIGYPLLNWLELRERWSPMLWVGVGILVLGAVLSAAFEIRLAGRPRLAAENTYVARQVVLIVAANIGLGALLSSAGTALGIVPEDRVSIAWGFLYANMAYMVGVVYMREYIVAGLAIAAGTLVAWKVPDYSGFILGPFMGLGMIIPGVMAERRVARLRRESGGAA